MDTSHLDTKIALYELCENIFKMFTNINLLMKKEAISMQYLQWDFAKHYNLCFWDGW